MKRYWLFGGADYYASGGMHDFIGSFDDVESAQRVAQDRERPGDFEWWHVFDSQDAAIVAKTEFQAYGTQAGFPEFK